MSALQPHVPLDECETVFSWVGRMAAIHANTSLVPFLNDLGIPPRDLETGQNGAHERLGDLTGVSPSAVARQHFFATDARRLRFRGENFAAEFAPKVHRMVCPLCLQRDQADVARGPRVWRFRMLWTVRFCAACPEHRVGLVPAAHREMGYVPEHDTGRAVGDRLGALVDAVTDRAVTDLQRWVTNRMLAGGGAGWLDGQSIDQAAKATEMLGVVLAHGPMPKMDRMTASDWDEAWQAGFEVTSQGAAAITEALERLTLAGRRASSAFKGPQANLGRLYQWLAFNESSGWNAGPIRDLVREHILDFYNVGAGEMILGQSVTRRRVHTGVSLGKATGLHHRTAQNLIADAGAPGGIMQAEAAEKLAADYAVGVPLLHVPRHLNCSRVHAQLLAEAGIIKPIGAAGICKLHTTFLPSELDRLLELLETRVDGLEPDSDMKDFARCAMSAHVASPRIVRAVLDGTLKLVRRAPGVRGYLGVRVSVTEVRQKLGGS